MPKVDEEDLEIFVSLLHKGSNIASSFLSERGSLNFPQQPTVVFMNIDNVGLCSNLFAVYHVYKNSGTSKRPFAMGMIGPFTGIKCGPARDFESKLYLAENKDFHHLQDLIAKNSASKNLCPNSRLAVSVQLLQGDPAVVRQDNQSVFKNSVEARKIGFPNVILPGDVRNDLYLTIEQGVFERTGKVRNVEVSAQVILQQQSASGAPLLYSTSDDCFVMAAGLDSSNRAVFPVIYHANNPMWMETVRLHIPIEQFAGSHIRFEYRHCSSKPKSRV